MKKKTILILAVGLVFMAIALQIIGNKLNADDGKSLNIDALRNFQYPGWSKSEVPLGDSPEMLQAVEKILSYDDYVSWNLESRGRDIQFYMAYWRPGKMSSKEVAMHTPDNCWVSAGWAEDLNQETVLSFDGINLSPAQDRIFSIHGTKRSVVFWHVYGDRVISYGKRKPSFWDGLKDAARDGLRLRQQQVFIRISSSANMTDVETWDAFRALLKVLSETVPSLKLDEGSVNKGHES